MKNNFKKAVSVLLAVLVLVLSASILFACNHRNEEEERQKRDRLLRTESVASVKDSLLTGIKEGWNGNLDYSAIASMDDAGEYVVTAGWMGLVGDVLEDSSLQTAKLVALSDFMKSEDGKKLVADFSENAELAVSLLKAVNFTATDISNLVYDLLCALVNKGDKVIDGIISDLNAVRSQPNISVEKSEALGAYIVDMGVAKNNFVPTVEERNAMLSAFSDAKAPMSELVTFFYDMTGAVSDDLFDAILGGEGALADISNGEIVTLVRTMRQNITDLKNALEGDAVANLNKAFDLIIDKFDTSAVSSVLYAQIVSYAKYAYMMVDVIPVMCDMTYYAGGVFEDETFIENLRENANKDINEYAKSVNISTITARVLLNITENFSAEQLKGIVNSIVNQSRGDYQKAVPLMLVDFVLNISKILEYEGDENFDMEDVEEILLVVHPEILNNDSMGLALTTIISAFDSSFEKFRQEYQKYLDYLEAIKAGNANPNNNNFDRLRRSALFFRDFGIQNPFNEFTSTQAWGGYYLSYGLSMINEKVDALMGKIAQDLDAFIDEFYIEESESRKAIMNMAEWEFVGDNISEEEYNVYMETVKQSRLMGIIAWLSAV